MASLFLLGGTAWAADPVPTETGICTPILTSSLSPTGGVFRPGDVIHYTITLAVPAVPDACTLDEVRVIFFPPQHSDLDPCDKPGGIEIASGLTLTPGTSFSWNGSDNPALDYVVQPSDAGAVLFAGVAFPFHVVGSDPPLRDCDEKTVQNFVECPKPCLEVTKDANCRAALVGDEIVYSICVRNCGEYDVNNLVVTDDLLGTLAGFPSTLKVGQQVCLDFPRVIKGGDPDPVVNVAHASGIDACDKRTPVSDDSPPVSIDVLHPAFTVTKTCVSEPLKEGDTASFEIVITNTGDVGLDLTTNDPEIPPFGLAAGAHHTQTVTEGPATFPAICDTIVVTGLQQEFCYKPAPIEHRASDCCDVTCPKPCIQVTKDANCRVALVGDEIVYSICVQNCGKNDLNNVVVTDDLLGPLAGFPSTLIAGQQVCLDFKRTVQAGDPDPVVNIAHASGIDDCDGKTPASDDSDPVSIDIVHPAFTVTKTCVSEPLKVGDTASFEIVITNTGDVGLNLTTNDSEIPPFSLAVGAHLTQTVTEGPATFPAICDTIVVNGIPQNFCYKPAPIEHRASDCCDVGCPPPCIQVTKEANCTVALVGDEIVYSVCVRNCGKSDLNNVVVTDDLLGTLAGFPSTLVPGKPVCLEFRRVVQAGDPDPVVNIAHARGIDDCDGKTPASDDSDPVSVDIVHPAFTVTKTCVSEPLREGDTASFEVIITNTGDVGLNVSTNDPEIPPFSLAVGAHHTQTVTDGPASPPAICDTIQVSALPQNFCEKPSPIVHSASDCCDVAGQEGCTPGFWKNHPDCWCDAYNPDDLVGDVFVIPSQLSALADDTLMDALNYGGGRDLIGKARNLLRHGVAALLNSCNEDVSFPTDPAGVIDMVNDALATLNPTEITRVQGILAGWNELGCPIDAHCRPIEDGAASQQSTLQPTSGDASLQSGLQPGSADAVIELLKPMPNPFTHATRLAYEVGAAGDYVKIEVYSATGRRVRTLANGFQSAGRHMLTWDGRSDEGQQVAGGVYFYHAVVGSKINNLRVVYLR